MQSTLFQQGVDLMLFGMGTVFVFLTLTVICVSAMSWIVGKFFAESEDTVESPNSSVITSSTSVVDPKVLAVIREAIKQHRAKK